MTPLCLFQNDQQLDCALDLMRRLPPQQIEKNLSDLIDLVRCHLLITAISTCLTHTHTPPPPTHTHTHTRVCDRTYFGESSEAVFNIAAVL